MKRSKVKVLKFFIYFIVIILIILSTGAALFVYFYPKDKLLNLITERAETTLQRAIKIKDISYSFGGVTLEKFFIYEGLSDTSPVIASAEEADLKFSLLDLIKLELNFNSITLKKSSIKIIFDDTGVSNIEKLIADLPKGDSGLTTKISTISLSRAAITLKNAPPSLYPLEGSYTVDATIGLDEDITVSDCTLILPEKRGTLQPSLTIKILDKDFEIKGKVGLRNASLLWVYKWGTNVSQPYDRLNGMVTDLTITKNYVRGTAKATSTLTNSDKLLKADGGCLVSIANRTVLLSKIQGGIDNSSFYIDTIFFTFKGKLIKFNVKNIDAEISDLNPLLNFLPSQLYGRIGGELSYADTLYNGFLSLKGIGFDRKNNIISDLRGDIKIQDNTFKKSNIPLKLFDNPCLLSIASTETSLNKIYINLDADKVSIMPDRMKFGDSKKSLKTPIEITGKINVNEFNYNNYTFSNIHLNYLFTGYDFTIPEFFFNFAEGEITGNGLINSSMNVPKSSLTLNFKGMRIQRMVTLQSKFRNRFFGSVIGTAKIDFELSDRIFKTAMGTVEFSIENGKLVDTGIQNGLGIWLSELKYKLRNLEFNKIYGNIDIRGTNYQINSFIFNSDNIKMKMTGMFNNDLQALPMYINLEFTRHFIQDVPGAITLGINKYLSGEWYTIPFILNGDITDSKNLKRVK